MITTKYSAFVASSKSWLGVAFQENPSAEIEIETRKFSVALIKSTALHKDHKFHCCRAGKVTGIS